jgi:general nucleoside transport system ATP-binding protein
MISMTGITKSFSGLIANDGIDLDVYRSEIHAVLGENGAGKSTLMKILYGFYRADSGRIALDGTAISIQSPRDALAAHIGMVFQDFTLIPAFSVAENIALFLHDLKPVLPLPSIRRRIDEVAARYSLTVAPEVRVSDLSIGEQQKVEILKLLLSDARLLILDEPTRVLAPHEIQGLLEVLQNLRTDGYAIVLITHKLREVLACADRITVLRKGRVSGRLLRTQADETRLVQLMFGKPLPGLELGDRPKLERSRPALELRQVNTTAEGAEIPLRDLDLMIYPGEIVGVAGVSGNGQRELADLILGLRPCSSGSKRVFGKEASRASVREMRDEGIGFIPENPLVMASVPFMSVLENTALTRTAHYARAGGLRMDWEAVRRDLQRSSASLGFDLPAYAMARSLSGGNLQRMVISREMAHAPRLIVASYLTRGLDAQSTIAARQALVQARRGGAAVLLISEDLDELFALSDRLIVLRGGRIVASLQPNETDTFQVGHFMTGGEAQHVDAG